MLSGYWVFQRDDQSDSYLCATAAGVFHPQNGLAEEAVDCGHDGCDSKSFELRVASRVF
jgi:hypothetical protein